ncbi:MAG: AAA family ATPase [Nitrospirota bacterium]
MYIKHFDLQKLPFENVPDPAFFFDQGDYLRVRSRVTSSLEAGRGLVVVTGPIGSGKTTLSQMIKTDFADNIKLIWIAEPPGNSTDLFLFISTELGLQPASTERVFILRDIREALLKIHSQGSKCLMIIDESHLMTDDVLDSIRVLNNLEEGSTKLIQILLLGQMEIMDKINSPEMKPFKQRIATLEIIGKMDPDRIRKYITYRIEVAGGSSSLITDTGWEALVLASDTGGGVPRIINSLCDKSLSTAFEREKVIVDIEDVSQVAEGMGIDKELFHYKISLRSREQEPPSNGGNKSTDTTQVLHEEPADSLGGKADRTEQESRKPVHSQPLQSRHEKGFSLPETDQKNLKIPVIFLTISIIALVLSIYLYCDKAGSSDLLTCLQELISF